MTSSGNTIKVTIYGNEYPVKGETDAEYIKEVAKYVDQKMQEVDRFTTTKSGMKIAILAALNIADELFREKLEREKIKKELEERIAKLSHMIDMNDTR